MAEQLDKRFGAIAVEKGFITVDQLMEALAAQVQENIHQNRHRLLGQILMQQGYLTKIQLDEILESLSRTMLYALGSGR